MSKSTDHQSQDTYSAVRWSAMSKYGAQAVQFGVSLLLARLLAPEYFGLLGMATVVTGFAKTLKNLGFNAAIIQRKDLDHVLLSTLFWVNLGFCLLITLLLVCLSPAVSWIYQDSRITPLVAILSLNIFIDSFSTVPSALLQRRLEFKKLAIREIGGVLVSAIVGVTGAMLGWGVWALVAATMSSSITSLILLNIVEPFRPTAVLDRTRLKECLKFGLNITGFNVFNYFARNADNLIIGIFLGPVALGYYSLAYKFMLLPRDSISRVVARVLFPKLSGLKEDDARLADVFLRATTCTAMVTLPAMAGLALVAGSFAEAFLGDKWLPAVPVIMITAPIGAIHSLTTLVGQIYLAKGRSDWMFRWAISSSMLYLVSFLIGVRWGVTGVAACYLVANLLLLIPCFSIPFRLVQNLSLGRLLAVMMPFLVATLVMVLGVMGTSAVLHYWAPSISAVVMLVYSVSVGVAIYFAMLLLQRPEAVDDMLKLVRVRVRTKHKVAASTQELV